MFVKKKNRNAYRITLTENIFFISKEITRREANRNGLCFARPAL